MKKQLSVMSALFVAASMSMAYAQELLFTATLQDKLSNRDELKGEIFPITFQNQTIGFVIGLSQQADGTTQYTDGNYGYIEGKSQRSLAIFSPDGKFLQNLPTTSKYDYIDDIQLMPFGDGGFCVIIESELMSYFGPTARAEEHIFYKYSNGTWNQTGKFLTGEGNNDESMWPNISNPTATFALFRDDGNKVVADVYVASKQTLTPALLPAITSDLSELAVKRGKSMAPYATTTNFTATGFSAVGLPAGLSINPISGVISGKTTVQGAFNVLLVVSQAGGQPVIATKRISVK